MLQNIRVLMTLVVWGGGFHFVFQILMCCKSCLCELFFDFLWRLIFSWNSSGFFCSFLPSVWTITLRKRKKSLSSGVCVLYLWLFCSNMQTSRIFFWHCTFNLKCFLYLLDINVLPFLIGLYKFFSPLIFYSNLKCGGCVSTGVETADSLVLASQLLPFSWNIFNIFILNITPPFL